jgi:hypothetical protein
MSYKVWSFSKGQLLSCLANDFVTADFIDSNKGKFAQSHYLAGYLEKLEAKTIIEEPDASVCTFSRKSSAKRISTSGCGSGHLRATSIYEQRISDSS